MPRNTSGVAQQPANTSAIPDASISSSKFNSVISDIYSTFNTAWPASLLPSLSAMGGQPINANLTSLSTLGTAIDQLAYTTALSTWAQTPITAFGRSLIDDADAATARTTLGAQASDATLTSLSGLSLAAGDILYATAADTVARLAKGTAAQRLAMNAGATAPEWVTPSGDSDTQVFPSSSTWTKPAWATANSRVYVRLWGGGGGAAGGGNATGGSGAAYCEAWFLASDLSATESVVVGTGGAGAGGTADGANGGDTTFKTFTAGGGIGGDSGDTGVAGGAVKKSGATFIAGGAAGALAEGWQGGGSESSSNGVGALKSIFGGAGGGSRNSTRTGGLSMFGGNGGNGSTSAGANGSVPGGGGGAVGGDGGNGLAIITTFR